MNQKLKRALARFESTLNEATNLACDNIMDSVGRGPRSKARRALEQEVEARRLRDERNERYARLWQREFDASKVQNPKANYNFHAQWATDTMKLRHRGIA